MSVGQEFHILWSALIYKNYKDFLPLNPPSVLLLFNSVKPYLITFNYGILNYCHF